MVFPSRIIALFIKPGDLLRGVAKNSIHFLINFRLDMMTLVALPCRRGFLYAYSAVHIAKRIINISESLYNYIMTPDSLCRQPFSELKGFFAMHIFYRSKIILRNDSAKEL